MRGRLRRWQFAGPAASSASVTSCVGLDATMSRRSPVKCRCSSANSDLPCEDIKGNTVRKSNLRKSSDALEIIDKNLIGDDAELRTLVEEATLNAQVAQSIYDARKAAGITQRELADVIGTTQSVVSQLENSDYKGHSLLMLRRVAAALHMCVEMKLVPEPWHSAV